MKNEFRAKNIYTGNWVIGRLIKSQSGFTIYNLDNSTKDNYFSESDPFNSDRRMVLNDAIQVYDKWGNIEVHRVDSGTIQRCLGIQDVKGKMIFEGDYDCDGNLVGWCDVCMGWQCGSYDVEEKDIYVQCHSCNGDFMFLDHIDEFNIVGNIIDNNNENK